MSASTYEQAFTEVSELKYLQPGENNLERLMFASDLGNTEHVSKEKLETFLKSCKWVGTATEFLYMTKKSRSSLKPSGKETVFLGLTAFGHRRAIKETFGAKDWSDGLFDKYGISMAFKNWAEYFVEELAKDDEVKNIVFLVPKEALSFYEKHKDDEKMPSIQSTEKELMFLLNNPQYAKKLMLVFGTDDLINSSEVIKLGGVDGYGHPDGSTVNDSVEMRVGEGFLKLTEILTGVKVIKKVEEAYKIMDGIQNFETSLREIADVINNRPGHIPKLGHIFLPINNNGFPDESLLGEMVLNKRDYVTWEPRKIIDEKRLSRRERYHSVAYFQDKEAKAIIDGWASEGTFIENESKLRQQNIDANVVRLLTHTNAPACKDFALSCMRFVAQTDSDILFKTFPTIGGGGDDEAQFWTIGPYILEALKEERFLRQEKPDDEQDFLKVLMWMKSRWKTGEWGYDAVYPGIGDLRREIHNLYLPRDGFHPIHEFVSRIGKSISSHLSEIYVDPKIFTRDNSRVRRLKV
ncbi:hypothetical protein A2572_01015 [Candidatus Collierbacteria bacterium RIFOXYD1_FULL_40_9]|uniref:Uncharacterized protein n=1 Tax=Candidatus Collierbacteria bacterium RIFOXYD1_FULL_40_9 TaxID=1817731 RepID=A0A1F5FTT2_9BACT|nr:MAG: hypothetical protein A2572_01015 [Candidatus Collierbacteria bacterium RIFOXYD1_FULL_40_9]